MLTRICATLALVVCGGLAGVAPAQEARISTAIASSDRIQEDLQAIIHLASPNLQRQWTNLKNVLDSFVDGVDVTKPIGLDLHLAGQEAAYVLKVPVTRMAGRGGFVNNVQAFGFKVSAPDPSGLYTIEQVRATPRGPRGRQPTPAPAAAPPSKPYYMREVAGHAVIAPRKDLVPANIGNPFNSLQKLVPGATDVAAALENDAAGMEAKRKAFQELRKQLEAAVEFRRGETREEFQLRKLSLEQNLNEAERFLIESGKLEVRWTTDSKQADGRGELLLTGLPGTALEDSIKQLVQKPSFFANVMFGAKPALQLRVNFAADDLRSQHAADLYAAMLPVLQATMDTRPNLNATGKTTAKDAIAKLFVMLNDAIPLKVLDGFIDVHASSDGKHVGLCGIRTADGRKATEILALFPQIRAGWEFQTDVDEHGGVKIHKMTIAPHRKEEFQAVFGGPLEIYIGVSEPAVWGAAGAGSLDALKKAIDQSAQPAPSQTAPEFVELQMRFEPWIKLLDAMRAKEPPSQTTDKEQLEFEKQRDKTRKYALETLAPGDDLLKTVLKRNGDQVEGTLEIQKGLLRLIGTLIADFTSENLR